ncbi:MAG: hypothetical protein WD823_05100 [Sulfuricaulis sp.]|uniref:hypothetical protein n=1 Tax=Sulfuricaulis sp. TaxID=2003553 RepID=UPI0034A23032
MRRSEERAISVVPRPVLALLAMALALQIAWQALQPKPGARADTLQEPPPGAVLRVVSLGEPIALAQWLTLYLQAFDNQPGVSIPFLELDYPRVIRWLESILALDPVGQYPLMMASQLYGQVPDERKQRLMMDFVHREFLRDPDRRWRWLAHSAIMAKHRLKDMPLALRYAEDITRHARDASNWARQMRIFILEDLGERESATVLLGGLLASGEVTDDKEIHFLTQRLDELKNAGKSSPPSKN